MGAVVLALSGRSDADFADAENFKAVAHHRKPVDQVRLDDGAGATAHHRQVHHQTKGLPIHQVGGCAVVGTREVFGLLDPAGATDPEPAAGGKRFFLGLHASQQGNFRIVEVAQLTQAFQVSRAHLTPALTAAGGFAAVGAIEDRVGSRSGCGEVAEPGDSSRRGLHTIWSEGHVRCWDEGQVSKP